MTNWQENLNALWTELAHDIDEASAHVTKSQSDASKRWHVRALLNIVEATNTNLRTSLAELLVARHQMADTPLDIHQLYLLLDEAVMLRQNGKRRLAPHRLPLVPLTAFIFRSWAEHLEMDPGQFFSDSGWDSFQKTIKIRNRLTHPKALEDLNITEEDGSIILAGFNWYKDVMDKLTLERAKLVSGDAS